MLRDALSAEIEKGDVPTKEGTLFTVEAIHSSPLTRAIETCLIGLSPILVPKDGTQQANYNVVLNPNLREKRNFMGRDSSGKYFGSKIQAELVKHLRTLYPGKNKPFADRLSSVPLDLDAVMDYWWYSKSEDSEFVQQRMNEVMYQLRFGKESSVALVGHSHFFREFLISFLGKDAKYTLANGQKGDAKDLKSKKLCNAGVMRCEVVWKNEVPMIDDVELLYDSTLIH